MPDYDRLTLEEMKVRGLTRTRLAGTAAVVHPATTPKQGDDDASDASDGN